MTTSDETYTSEEFFDAQTKYWTQVEESDGFDIENISTPSRMSGMITGLIAIDCQRYRHYADPVLVKRYAKLGLHRYNMLKGTRFELTSLMKFNTLSNIVSSYYMTLLAHDPTAAGAGQTTFQVRIDEQSYGKLHLTVSIARIKDEVTTEKPFIPHFHGCDDPIFKGRLPDWPSDETLKDTTRFYMVKRPEWQDTDWIYQYLELVICVHDRRISNDLLSQMKIVKVAVETSIDDAVPLNERLKAKRAIIYIWFKGLADPFAPLRVFEIGEEVERLAIIRRVFNERTGDLALFGVLWGGAMRRSMALESGEQAQSSAKRSRLG